VVLDFLSELFDSGLSYSALNLARSALSSFMCLNDGTSVGSHPLVARFLRGVFNLRPPQAKYKEIWEVRPVFNYLRKLSPVKFISLKQLTLKLCMLIALLSAQRTQTLHLLTIDSMVFTKKDVQFRISEFVKQSRPGHVGTLVELQAYPADRRLCVVTVLKAYLERTKGLRGNEKKLFISFVKPHESVSKDTIA